MNINLIACNFRYIIFNQNQEDGYDVIDAAAAAEVNVPCHTKPARSRLVPRGDTRVNSRSFMTYAGAG